VSGVFGTRQVPAEATRPLRHAVLRPGAPEAELVYPGDDAPATCHLAVFAEGCIVAVASLYAEPHPDIALPRPGWRLRGMATAGSVRGRGAGRMLLQAVLDRARADGAALVWCNARTPASGFYRRCGFEAVGAEFEIPGIGPHRRMHRLM
jgi:GNAT superfamily N-acetyltransferase